MGGGIILSGWVWVRVFGALCWVGGGGWGSVGVGGALFGWTEVVGDE